MSTSTPYLTPTELSVLEDAAKGLYARESAERLGISPEAARRIRMRILRKLGATTIAHAVFIHYRRAS